MNQASDQNGNGQQRHAERRPQVLRTVWWLVATAALVYLVFILSGVFGRA